MATSIGEPVGVARTARALPRSASNAATPRNGSNGSERLAATSRAADVANPSATPIRRTARSRRDGVSGVHGTSTQMRLKTSVPLVPPKPNEFFSATSMRISRAVFAQ